MLDDSMTNQHRKRRARAQNYSRRSPLQKMPTILGGWSATGSNPDPDVRIGTDKSALLQSTSGLPVIQTQTLDRRIRDIVVFLTSGPSPYINGARL
jgi:hypothetical protein